MEDSKPDSFFLRSTSALSLHDRFSQLTQSRMVTFDPALLQQKRASAPPPLVLLVNSETPSPPCLRIQDSSLKVRRRLRRRRRSIWTRLGWQQLTRRLPASKPPRGFWSFKNKYRWRARSTSTSTCTCRRRSQLSPHLQRGGAIAYRGRGPRKPVPTKKQLDAQLDDYMSLSKSRLDAELDEYMSMAGQTQWD